MKVKSLEELKKIRERANNKVDLRKNSSGEGNEIELLVGMATCGIASGARETFVAFEEEIKKEGLKNVKVVPVGCIGSCHSEPVVQVNIPGKDPVVYGEVDKEKAKDIIHNHIKNNEIIRDLIIDANYDHKQE